MSKVIDIFENKILSLKNVFEKSILIDDKFGEKPFELRIKEFVDYCKNNKIETFGPLIIKTSLVGNEDVKVKLSFMVQTKLDEINAIFPYSFTKELKTMPSLFARFEGKSVDSEVATYKMKVYAYENDLILDNVSYTITKEVEDNNVIVDTFVPIIGRC